MGLNAVITEFKNNTGLIPILRITEAQEQSDGVCGSFNIEIAKYFIQG